MKIVYFSEFLSRYETTSTDELGYSEDEWAQFSTDEQESILKNLSVFLFSEGAKTLGEL